VKGETYFVSGVERLTVDEGRRDWQQRIMLQWESSGEKQISRMLKKAGHLTRPTPARQDAPFHRQGRSDLSLTKGWLG
jgi:hypothetical protein